MNAFHPGHEGPSQEFIPTFEPSGTENSPDVDRKDERGTGKKEFTTLEGNEAQIELADAMGMKLEEWVVSGCSEKFRKKVEKSPELRALYRTDKQAFLVKLKEELQH